MLTNQERAVIHERAAAATNGPWRSHDTWLTTGGYAQTVLSGEGKDTELRAWLPTFSHSPAGATSRNVVPDAEFIAHAREDIPNLLNDLHSVDQMLEQSALAAFLHSRNDFDYDECPHGTYAGGPSHGEPYAMCERQAAAIRGYVLGGDARNG